MRVQCFHHTRIWSEFNTSILFRDCAPVRSETCLHLRIEGMLALQCRDLPEVSGCKHEAQVLN